MSSTYSSYKFELIGTGEQAGTWGTSTNTNLGTAIEQAIGGYVSVAFTGLTKSLTLTNTNAAQDARALYLNLTGTPGGAATLEVPAIQKAYIIKNATTGGFAVTAKVSGMTGVLIPNGKTMLVYNNGTDVVVAENNFNDGLTLGTTVLTANSASDALRITQTGAGNALLVEDEANPDTSPFVVDSAGRVGIGIATPGAVSSLRISRRFTGATAGATVYADYTVASDVTGSAATYRSDVTTDAAAFTLPFLTHYIVTGLTVGAGSTVTDQRGFSVAAAAVGATNNYGVFSFLPAGTNNWNLYASGTAPNYMAGALGIGSVTLTGFRFRVGGNIGETSLSSGVAYGASVNPTFESTVTAGAFGVRTGLVTAASAFTAANVYHFTADSLTLGAGSAATNQFGFYANSALTNATNNYGLYSAIPSGTNNWNLYASNTAPNYMAGALGIGTTTLTGYRFRVAGTLSETSTGSGTAINIASGVTYDSTVNVVGYGIRSTLGTAASAFTLSNLYHFTADSVAVGAGSTVTSQVGFITGTGLTSATNNYGFYGNVPAGANNWNIYNANTAPNYMTGALGIGTTTLAAYNFRIERNLTGGINSSSISNDFTALSDVTSNVHGVYSQIDTQNAVYTLTNLQHFTASGGTKGASSTITFQYGFLAQSTLSQATNNYAFYTNLAASGSNNWGFYSTGTAPNYMAGSLGIGTTTLTGHNLRIAKTITGAVNSYAVSVLGQVQTDVTSSSTSYLSLPSTPATAFTLPAHYHYAASDITVGGGSTVTQQRGFTAFTLSGATNNYGFYGSVNTGAGSNWNLYLDGTAPNYMAGSLGIGSTTLTGYTLRLGKNLTGATSSVQVAAIYTAQSDVTTAARTFQSSPATQATAYTLGNLYHFVAEAPTVGAGSTITNQFGVTVAAGAVGATNNYGIVTSLPSGANNWNIYAGGTAKNYLEGSLGIGVTSSTASLAVGKNLTGGTVLSQVLASYTVQSDVTAFASSFDSLVQTQFTAFTLGNLVHYRASGLILGGGGSAVTNQYCFFADNVFGATNNYGFYADIDAGANKWNFYANATANNAFRGNSRFGDLTAPVAVVDVTGNVAATTSILSTGATSGIGYATGAGGTITQGTSRTTPVTLNKVTGAITLVSAAGSASYQSFTVTNSAVAATDVVIVNQKSGTDKYITLVTNVAAGSFQITFATTGGTTTEQPVFNFAVIKAVTA
jgi:hypothetical protein